VYISNNNKDRSNLAKSGIDVACLPNFWFVFCIRQVPAQDWRTVWLQFTIANFSLGVRPLNIYFLWRSGSLI